MGEDYISLWMVDNPGFPKDIRVSALTSYTSPDLGKFFDPNKYFPKESPVNMNVEKTDQQIIDDEVRAALAKPRREAEVAKRVAAIEAIGWKDQHEIGTVLRWKRTFKSGNITYVYAAIKVDEDKWFVTGNHQVSSCGWTWDRLVEWMTTGDSIVEDLQSAADWTTIL